MKIESLKDLEALISTMRKHGVLTMKVDGLEFQLGPQPQKKSRKATSSAPTSQLISPGGITEDTPIRIDNGWDALTDEQKLMYSAGVELPTEG